jgi:hypothetical protein
MLLLEGLAPILRKKKSWSPRADAGDTIVPPEFQDTVAPSAYFVEKNPLMGGDMFSTPWIESTQVWATKSVERVISTQPTDLSDSRAPLSGALPVQNSWEKNIPSRPKFGRLNANMPYLTGLHMYQFEKGESYAFYALEDALAKISPGEKIQTQVFTVIREYREGEHGKWYIKLRWPDGMDYALQPSGIDREGKLTMSRKDQKLTDYREKKEYLLADLG